MQLQAPHPEVRQLFGAMVDDELEPGARAELQGHLADCEACEESWRRYSRAVLRVRGVERERVPERLASLMVRRTRRRALGVRIRMLHQHHRVPAELVLLLMLAAAAVALLGLLHP